MARAGFLRLNYSEFEKGGRIKREPFMDRLRPQGKENGKREIVERIGKSLIEIDEKFQLYDTSKT